MLGRFAILPKWNFFAAILLALALSACTSAANPVASPTDPVELAVQEQLAAAPQASCTAVSSASREEALANSPFATVSSADWQRGSAGAQVTIIEYSDFQCPFCATLAPALAELENRYPQDLRVVYRHFPLIGTPEQPIHANAALATQASEAAGRQDKFWEMHDLLFSRQAEWSELSAEDFEAWLLDVAAELELDETQFASDLHSAELQTLALQAWESGRALGLGGTPFLLINGIPYQGPADFYSLETILRLELLRERQFNECPAFNIDPEKDYTATLHTEKGNIVIRLLPEQAPMAVNSFVFLAQNDWFDNVTFHRVLPGFVAQAGDPSGTGYGGPGYTFEIEISSNLLFDRAGLLAMANSGPTSNGSQFFITLAPAEHLNAGFTIFGEVLSGMDVVQKLAPRDPSQGDGFPDGDLILDVNIEVN